VFAREVALRVLGVAALIYSSFSFGYSKHEGSPPSGAGRIVLFLNRSVSHEEYGPLWDSIDHLLGGGFDEHGRSSALCYGRHVRRSQDAPHRRVMIDGAALDADALIELGRSLIPASAPIQPGTGRRHTRDLTEELERTRLLGAVFPPDQYGDWMPGAGAFKRRFPDNPAAALQCFDVWSACSDKYDGPEATRQKFDQVSAEYSGSAAPVTVEMLHCRGRRRAEAVIAAIYPAAWALAPPPAQFVAPGEVTSPGNELSAGVLRPKGPEPIAPGSITPEDGTVALEYLRFCWGATVWQQITERHTIPKSVLEEVQRRVDERREKVELDGRTLHIWSGNNLAADTQGLAQAITRSNTKLFRCDKILMLAASPACDDGAAARLRQIYGYRGPPNELGDPALRRGERLVPILSSDPEALREIIAAKIATKRRVNIGTKKKPEWHEEFGSFGFKSNAKIHEEPDAGVLKDLIKRGLVNSVPEVQGVITAPVMPALPASTRPDDLLQSGAECIITSAGYDAASGLYLAPLGRVVDVPETPSQSQIKEAAALLRLPWADFPFASPGADLPTEVGRAVCIYSILLAANRRAIDIAPGIAVTSHGEGMSSGKTLLGEVPCIIATGEVPAAVSLSPDFTEQRKEIVTYLLVGDGCLFLDNIPTGVRFDAAPLASAMTSGRLKGRLLGANKQVVVSTRALIVATGNSLNLAGDLASRCLLVRLDTGLERPEDRSAQNFKIPDLRQWVVEHRQRVVAAVHTIVRGYLQESRRRGGTPPEVAARRQVEGTRFGGPCEVMRDALLWAFPDLPDPFLSFRASAANSSTKGEAELVLHLLDSIMVRKAGEKCAPATPQWNRWHAKFHARWARMTPNEQARRYGTQVFTEAKNIAWQRLSTRIQTAIGQREVRSGRARFTAAEIMAAPPIRRKFWTVLLKEREH
jgi:hypothetical protein